MSPGPEFGLRKDAHRILVADFHIVDAGTHTRIVHGAHELVRKAVAIDQSAITYGAIQDFQFRSIVIQGAFSDMGVSHKKR